MAWKVLIRTSGTTDDYECDQCGTRFELKKHQRPPVQCPQCRDRTSIV